MTRTFQRITSLILVSLAVSLSGCKTGDTSLDKLVSSVSGAASGQPSDPQSESFLTSSSLEKLSDQQLCSRENLLKIGIFSHEWQKIVAGKRYTSGFTDGSVCWFLTTDYRNRRRDNFDRDCEMCPQYLKEAQLRGLDFQKCAEILDVGKTSELGLKISPTTELGLKISPTTITPTAQELERRGITPNQCANQIGLPIPVPLAERKTANLCKEFKPFEVGDFTASFKSGVISKEIQKRKVSLKTCMKMAGLTPPKPLSAYTAQSLCKKFQPFSTSQFSVSFKSNDIAAAVKQTGISPEACMKMAGLTPPKPLAAYDLKSICNFLDDFDAVIVKEKKRRKISSLDCQITRGMVFKEQDYLSATPSKRVTPYLTDLDLCRFLKFKKPPHLKAAVKKRRLRCDMLLRLDEFERSVN